MGQPIIQWGNRIVGSADVSPTELTAHPQNWRRHPALQQAALAGVLEQIGWIQDVIVNRRSGHLVDGHLRVELARRTGQPTVPVTYIDLDPEEEALALATLDPLAELATADAAALTSLLEEVATTDPAVQRLLDDLLAEHGTHRGLVGRTDPDAVPQLPAEPISRPGDLWTLGPHRLLCGDSRRPADLAALMAGERADCLWTDPPYGVDYVGKTAAALTLRGDEAAGLERLLRTAFRAAADVLVPGAPFYIAHSAGPLAVVFLEVVLGLGWRLRQSLIWVKDSFVLGRGDYHYRHEPLLFGTLPEPGRSVTADLGAWLRAALDAAGAEHPASADRHQPLLFGYLPGPGRPGRGGAHWHGDNAQDSVFEVSRPKASREHPTAKPTQLIAAHLTNSTRPGAIVLDGFAGSGSTLIAAAELGRVARLVELDPRYCDVVVERWEAFSGAPATRSPAPVAAAD